MDIFAPQKRNRVGQPLLNPGNDFKKIFKMKVAQK